MAGLTQALWIAANGLRAYQRSIEVTSQNVANADNPHYARRRVRYEPVSLRLGGGVRVGEVRALRDEVLEGRVRLALGRSAHYAALAEALGSAEALWSGVDLEGRLAEFWGAWEDLAASPQDGSLRSALLGRARSLCAALRGLRADLQRLRRDLDEQVVHAIPEVNGLLARLAELNRCASRGMDVEDERARTLEELQRWLGGEVLRTSEGVRLSVGGRVLVEGGRCRSLSAQLDPETGLHRVCLEDGWEVTGALGGVLGARLEARDGGVAYLLERLDGMTSALIEAVNDLHRTGYGLDGSTGLEFFTGGGAADVRVSPQLLEDPARIAAASAAGEPANNEVALQIAALREEPLWQGSTLEGFLRAVSAEVGAAVQRCRGLREGAEAFLEELQRRRDSLSGVSLEEELAQLGNLQNLHLAMGKVLSAVNETLEELMRNL